MLPHPIIYVTRDIERALGLPTHTPNFFIVTNASSLAKSRDDIYTIDSDTMLDTFELLAHDDMKKIMKNHPGAHIVVFKNTGAIEKICAKENWPLLNPPAELAARVEEKISQVAWLDELSALLPSHHITKTKKIVWNNEPFILQYNRAHTGSGTHYIDSQKKLSELQQLFPERDARVTVFISGPVVTSNNIVTPTKIMRGNINYQITGLPPFTDNPFATIGNDWALPHTVLSDKAVKQYDAMIQAIGAKLRADGWKGLFGTDVIYCPEEDTIYLIEINARQPASTTFESVLSSKYKGVRKNSLTIFEAHLLSLFDELSNEYTLIDMHAGAQLVVRVPMNGEKNKEREHFMINEVTKLGCSTMLYNNDKPGSDWIRIKSEQSFMNAHNVFNDLGNKIKEIVNTHV